MGYGYIFIYYEYEDNDDIVRWIVCEYIVLLCVYLELVIELIFEIYIVLVLDDVFNNLFI